MNLTDVQLLWVIVLSGLATLLTRWLPMAWQARARRGRRPDIRLRRCMDAIGPSAIVALLLAAFWDMVSTQPSMQNLLPIVCGLAGVALAKRLFKSIAWGTLGGVLCYGVTLWALGHAGF